MRGFRLWGAIAVVLAIAAGGFAYWRRGSQMTAAAPAAQPAAEIPEEVSLPGKIRAQHVVELAPPQDGIVTAFFADVGQDVYEGMLIAKVQNQRVDADQLQAQRAAEAAQNRVNDVESAILATRLEASRARAEASRARSEHDRLERVQRRQEMLFREGATSKNRAEQSQRDYDLAKTEFQGLESVAQRAEDRVTKLLHDLDAAKKTLEEKNADLEGANQQVGAQDLLSPVQGVVVGRKGEVGAEITVDKTDFFQIAVDLSLLEITVDPEPPVLKVLKVGQPALIVIAGLPGEGILGSVKAQEGTQVIVPFTSPNPSIKPGQTAQVRIKLK
jgi:multidrug resistance efflux pump